MDGGLPRFEKDVPAPRAEGALRGAAPDIPPIANDFTGMIGACLPLKKVKTPKPAPRPSNPHLRPPA